MLTFNPTFVRLAPRLLAALLATSAVGGCVKVDERPSAPPRTQVRIAGDPPAPAAPPRTEVMVPPGSTPRVSLDDLAKCDGRLHDLCGPIMQYYVLHKSLPPRLADLSALGGPGEVIELTCPFTNQPYGYVPPAINPPPPGDHVVVYAPGADKDGMHGVIVFNPASGPRQIPAASMTKFTAAQLKPYLQRGPQANSASGGR